MATNTYFQIPRKIHMIAHNLQIIAERILTKQFKIQFNRFLFLQLLDSKGNLSQQELSQLAGITPAATSKNIQTLLKKGFIKTKINPENRRKHIVILTAKGKALQQNASNILAKEFELVLGNIKGMTNFEATLDSIINLSCSTGGYGK